MSKANPVVLRHGADDPDHRKGYWVDSGDAIKVCCPLCGLERTMPLEIQASGAVLPAYKCGYHCKFSEFISLEGWTSGHRPMDIAWITQSRVTVPSSSSFMMSEATRRQVNEAMRELDPGADRLRRDRETPPL